MVIFKSYTYRWWQIGLLKLSLLALGVAIGAYWAEFFLPYFGALILVGIALGIYLMVVSVKQ